MYTLCTDGFYFLDDPCNMAVRPRPVLAAQLGYCKWWYNLCRGIWNSAVMCMCAEYVSSCFFGYLCDSHVGVWCLFSVMDCTEDKLSTIVWAVYCCIAISGGTLQGYLRIVLVASTGFWMLTSHLSLIQEPTVWTVYLLGILLCHSYLT